MDFWHTLPNPFFSLAPLEGVADTVFRQIVAGCAKPDVFFTEFTSADGFCSPGRERVTESLQFTDMETPIIAQIWGNNPETLYETAKALPAMGFSGVDINMGCPDRTVVGHGCGAALIDTPEVAALLIHAVKDGVAASGTPIPVSVKTRVGYKKQVTREWVSFLLEQGIAALTIHARTASEMSKVPARWEEISKAVEIRNRMQARTVIIGNGDVIDVPDGRAKAAQYGADGIMIGRGIFANLWAFDRSPDGPHVAGAKELLGVMNRHITLFHDTWGDRKNYAILKKFYKIYVNGFHGATDWRVRFMDTNTAKEALTLLSELSSHLRR